MTLIVSPLQQLIKSDRDPQRQAIYTTIRRNATRILHLINEIMDLRKIDKGQMAMHMRETDMVKFINDVYSLFTQQAKSQHINLTFVHDTDSLPVWFDPNNFDKVLVNIISNAFKYTSAGGNIRITLTHTETEVRLSFFDDGESIPEDKIQHIFERFYQAPTESNDRKIGTGIGLDLTRSLVELHYGNISVHNNIDAPGCEFIVTLPLGNSHLKPSEMEEVEETSDELTYNEMNALADDIEQHIETTPEQISEQIARRTREKILIAEDDYEISQYLEQELSQEFDIVVCANGKDALETALRDIPSLVISDIMMPVMDGITLSSRLRNNINTNDIPIILLTGKNTDEDRLKGLETGADAYIVKPFNMDILHRTVINLIAKRNILRNKFTGNESQEHKLQQVTLDAPDSKLMDRVMDVINSNISNTDLSVDMVANEVGISRVHLYRKMKELTNQTPHGFIRNIRLKQAAKLLSQPGQNITEVMYACGFSNLASFSTMFKGLYGMSPREYASKNR
jgi:DNA-binding response OmpR family regulator